MHIILYIALGYLLVTTVILLANRTHFKKLQEVPPHFFDRQAPRVGICIPARNEEQTIERCVRSVLAQKYPNFHLWVLNDQSTDRTGAILSTLQETFADRMTVIEGRPKPASWLGKPWACHQLAAASDGEILLFLDADVWLTPGAVARTVRTMARDVLDFLTVWPDQKLGTFWEKNVIPLIYFALLTLLPVAFVRRLPGWIPSFIGRRVAPLFAAACGQFMAFKRKAYERTGGHESVKHTIVEDVQLAQNIKKAGGSMNMYHGGGVAGCRMYHSRQELREGLRKNFLAGFGYRLSFFIGMALLHLITFLLPVVALPFFIWNGQILLSALCILCISLMFLQRLIINRWFGWNPFYALLHPLGVTWFQLLGIRVIRDYLTDTPASWKGRKL